MVDCGMKYNQLRCFLRRGVEIEVVPWNHSFDDDSKYDGLFISNGPGDPQMCKETVANLKKLLKKPKVKPIFGICLGHQLLAIAAGCSTYKMKYGELLFTDCKNIYYVEHLELSLPLWAVVCKLPFDIEILIGLLLILGTGIVVTINLAFMRELEGATSPPKIMDMQLTQKSFLTIGLLCLLTPMIDQMKELPIPSSPYSGKSI